MFIKVVGIVLFLLHLYIQVYQYLSDSNKLIYFMGSEQTKPNSPSPFQTPMKKLTNSELRLSSIKKDSVSPFKTGPIISTEPRLSEPLNNDGLAETILKMSLQHKSDQNVTQMVKSRLSSLPVSDARVTKNVTNNGIITEEHEIYDPFLKAKFIGQKVNGKPHGFGKLYFENNDYLEGTFVEGRCEGEGRIIKADGSYYEGQIKNNQADGHGKYYGIDGFKYEGQWKNNMPNGTGQANYKDGSRYIGQFLNDKKNGKGVFITNTGDMYEGQFKNNKIHGFCTYVGKNGQRYQGEWLNGMKHGAGVYEWPNGRQYDGQYKYDKRHGTGTMYYNQNQKYIGQWANGQKHGHGIYETAKQKIDGIWVKGELTKIKQ